MSIRASLIERLFERADPFADFRHVSRGPDASVPAGWGSTHPYFEKYIDAVRPRTIIEVGSWLGGSAVTMGRLLKAKGLDDSCIICVDTWLGSAEHYLQPELRDVMKFVAGRPTFYQDFMCNIVRHGLEDVVVPLSLTSIAAADVFKELPLSPDLVYLDGDHSERGFRTDLELYWEILKPGGVLIGDDFDWDSVHLQVINFTYEQKVEFTSFRNKFVIRKPE